MTKKKVGRPEKMMDCSDEELLRMIQRNLEESISMKSTKNRTDIQRISLIRTILGIPHSLLQKLVCKSKYKNTDIEVVGKAYRKVYQ
jgi:hypothetical protein